MEVYIESCIQVPVCIPDMASVRKPDMAQAVKGYMGVRKSIRRTEREMLEKLNNMQIKERLKKSFTLISGMMAIVAVIGVIGVIVVSRLYASALVNYGFS